jgi:hypothetical protein
MQISYTFYTQLLYNYGLCVFNFRQFLLLTSCLSNSRVRQPIKGGSVHRQKLLEDTELKTARKVGKRVHEAFKKCHCHSKL